MLFSSAVFELLEKRASAVQGSVEVENVVPHNMSQDPAIQAHARRRRRKLTLLKGAKRELELSRKGIDPRYEQEVTGGEGRGVGAESSVARATDSMDDYGGISKSAAALNAAAQITALKATGAIGGGLYGAVQLRNLMKGNNMNNAQHTKTAALANNLLKQVKSRHSRARLYNPSLRLKAVNLRRQRRRGLSFLHDKVQGR